MNSNRNKRGQPARKQGARGRTLMKGETPGRTRDEMEHRGRKTVARRVSGRTATEQAGQYAYCSMRQTPERQLAPDLNPRRLRLIRTNEQKWANGTVLHYYFFDRPTDGESIRLPDGSTRWMPWATTDAEKDVVRKAFDMWKQVGVGLRFEEVSSRSEAELRIGFMREDGAWSYVGRDVLRQGQDERTMNFGWDLTEEPREFDTALHEIGHTLGFPHEHQNPYAGIVWDEEAVYAALARPPNRWDRQTTYYNIIRKLDPNSVEGSTWDPNSVMHYPFEKGLIKEPKDFFRKGLRPAGGLSARDREWVKTFYPALADEDYTPLQPFQSIQLQLEPGQQRNFTFSPPETRVYEMRTFGVSDTVMVLFEDVNGQFRYLAGDDDSGMESNAYLKVKLFQDLKYVLRVRLYYEFRSGETALMLW